MSTSARDEYLACFGTPDAARRFERFALSAPEDSLPESVRRVKGGWPKDESYWRWLVEQVHKGGER